MRKVLGLDIGITSVGWGIIDIDENRIIDAGVRLFEEADKEKNVSRRGFRSGRRLKRRRVTRKNDLKSILIDNNLYSEYSSLINPYEVRCKGLKEKLSLEELNAALFHICKHRGSSLEVIEDDETKKTDSEGTKKELAENDQLLKAGKYVCEIQLDRLKTNGRIRGISNNFRSSDYEKELAQLLKVQEIDSKVSEDIIKCILRRRNFSDGPGSPKSPSIYGRIFDENGNVKVSMIEKMTGKCSIFVEELRAPSKSPSAEFFNLLNDLNNLKLHDGPIDITVKQDLVKTAFEKGSITPKAIAKVLGADEEEITGFRIDKDSKPLITKLEGFNTFRKIFNEYGISNELSNFDLLDNIAVILTKTKVKSERINELKDKCGDLPCVEELANLGKFTTYHSLSLKALRIMNEELYNTEMNQMQILHLSNKFDITQTHFNQKGKKKISVDDEAILSPVAMRSYRQAIKVVNAVRSKYGELDSIIVETTRDKNSSEERKRISESQKYYEKINKKANELLEKYPNIKPNSKLIMKLRLYEEQGAKTAYTQQPIDLDLLICDSDAYEIDHIIPISVSLDDSINNKALVSRQENQEKGQLSPLMAYEKHKFTNGNLDVYKAFIKGLFSKKCISRKKYLNYMFEKDINKYENMKEFIARNLVDTSYANRLVFNTLMNYFKDNGIGTKVFTVRGQATSAFRKRIKGLEKDRDVDYSHHAIDALIVASIKKLGLYDKLLKDFGISNKEIVYNKETGEVIEINDDLLLDERYLKFINELVQYKVTKYSWKIDTKPNRSIADQTIYSTRNYGAGDMVIKKYKNIYDSKFFNLANDVINDNTDRYLMAKHDPQTFEKIKNIVVYYYNEFKDDSSKITSGKKGTEFKFNPLSHHLEMTGEYITKYSKKNNGPIITSMKYVDGKLGSYVDISQNYKSNDKKVVLLQISPYRTDFYLDNGVYKFVTVRYSNVKYSKSENTFYIDEEWYNEQKQRKNISKNAEFCFSMHRNEIFEITNDREQVKWKFTATNNDNTNKVEVKPMNCYEKKQLMPTISRKITSLKKYSCDTLGNLTEIKDSVLKLKFK